MKIKLATLIITVFFTSSLFAKVSLPDILSDNMVLQQNSSVKLWGKADPGKTIKITSSWNKKGISTKADEQGRWLTNFNTPEASFSPQTITFSDGEKTILTNILIGEVWFASGLKIKSLQIKFRRFHLQCAPNGLHCLLAFSPNKWKAPRKLSQKETQEA